jgi:hypothetical protein
VGQAPVERPLSFRLLRAELAIAAQATLQQATLLSAVKVVGDSLGQQSIALWGSFGQHSRTRSTAVAL